MIPDADEVFRRAEQSVDELRIREAIDRFRQAEQAGYDADACAARRWTCHMLRGEFAEAWCESDSIALRDQPDPNRFWNGKPLAGDRILIRCLHGLGDTLQFIRYAKLLRAQGRHITIEAQPALKGLLQQSDLADHVITWGEPEQPWDQQVEVMELPRIFRVEEHSIPRAVPYLFAPAQKAVCDSRKLRAGIVWCASSYDRSRTIPADALSRLVSLKSIEFVNLQAGPEQFDLSEIGISLPIPCEADTSIAAVASQLRGLDLVITVDTMMAHLAGAMGRPVWTLLPYRCDWRWMLDREDSPWYPSMRLLRQPGPGDWNSVMDRVRADLRVLQQTCARVINRKPD